MDSFRGVSSPKQHAQLVAGSTSKSCFIDRLPPEILGEIFLFHYYTNEERPVKLFYISHRWNNIARETRALWSIIRFLCPERRHRSIMLSEIPKEFKWETSMAIQTFSLNELLKAIERLSSTKFTFILDICPYHNTNFDGHELFPAVKSLISRRCTTLIVNPTSLKHGNLGPLWDSNL
ncbi:hypothetical protein CPB86DRAFT_339998 [Serendipita vermifera]|nr:hypothetical protein CPB86DRAFT_339998 [Serendipita vermifera]